MEEKWMPVIIYKNGVKYDFTNIYAASNYGRIKSLNRYDYSGHLRKEKYLRTNITNKNRETIQLSLNSNKEWFQVSRIVWESFNGKIPEGYEINHIDENPRNNNLTNLNLMTRKDNLNWGTRNERAGKNISKKKIGIKNLKNQVAIEQFSVDNIFIKLWPSAREVCNELGFCATNITACCRKRIKTAYGYLWKYKE